MLKNLIEFANALFTEADWPDGGDIDGFEFQEIAVKYGLLLPEIRHEPCGEVCSCAEVCNKDDWTRGVTCYRKAEWLNSDVEPRVPTTDAPEMTVGDSDSVSEDDTDETAGEGIQLVSCTCPKCGTTWSEPVLPPVKTTRPE